MKICDAKQAYSAQLNALWGKKQSLSKLLKDQESSGTEIHSFDRVEISRELSEINTQYEATQSAMEGIIARENAIHDSEVARQQSDTMAKAAEETAKMMEVFRRISSGAKVPSADEMKLMEYNHELYMAAKTAAMMAQQNDEEYDSLWEDEGDESGEVQDAHEIAENSEISVPEPEVVAAEAVAEMSQDGGSEGL